MGERVAAAALATVGCRFRLHGRDPGCGLDCVGVVAVALAGGGWRGVVPSGYALRTGDVARVRRAMAAAGLVAVADAGVGDVVAAVPGAGQLHLGIVTADGLVHADAGLRRVVVRPGTVAWPVVGVWRVV